MAQDCNNPVTGYYVTLKTQTIAWYTFTICTVCSITGDLTHTVPSESVALCKKIQNQKQASYWKLPEFNTKLV